MLKHETETVPEYQSPSQPAEHVRVTPEELAAAIASVEARKEQLAGTISLGDAVNELNLSATPEELLAAVEAKRRAVQQQTAVKNNTKHSQGQATKVLTGFVIGFTLMIMLLGFLFTARQVSAPAPPITIPFESPQGITVTPSPEAKPPTSN
jgi:ABC-type Na+ efflux pump permease subunit